MSLFETLQSMREEKGNEILKTRFSEHLCEIRNLETELTEQIERRKKHCFPFSKKLERLDCYNQSGEKIITYYYNKATGNRERTVLLREDIVIHMRYKKHVTGSESRSDCACIEMFDNHPGANIKKVTEFLNGHGEAVDYIYEMLVTYKGEQIRLAYNGDGVLLPYNRDEALNLLKSN